MVSMLLLFHVASDHVQSCLTGFVPEAILQFQRSRIRLESGSEEGLKI